MPDTDNDRVIVLRGTSSSFSVQLPPHAFLKGPFTLKCVGAVLTSSFTTLPVAIHCSYGSGVNIHDSSGHSNAIAFLTSDWDRDPVAPLIKCPSLGDGPDRVTVQVRDLSTGDLVSTVTLCVIVLELHRE